MPDQYLVLSVSSTKKEAVAGIQKIELAYHKETPHTLAEIRTQHHKEERIFLWKVNGHWKKGGAANIVFDSGEKLSVEIPSNIETVSHLHEFEAKSKVAVSLEKEDLVSVHFGLLDFPLVAPKVISTESFTHFRLADAIASRLFDQEEKKILDRIFSFFSGALDKLDKPLEEEFEKAIKIMNGHTTLLQFVISHLKDHIEFAIHKAERDFFEKLDYPAPLNHIKNGEWMNWGHTLKCKPKLIYSDDAKGAHPSPRTVEEIRNIIKQAKASEAFPIRVFGSSHSWAALVQTEGTLVDGRQIGWKPSAKRNLDVFDQDTVVASIDPQNLYVNPNNDGKPTVTFPPGMATGTVERFIYITPKDIHGNKIEGKRYSLPTTTYEDVFTMGGIVSAACHGTGKNYPTVSDWIVSIEFVDAEGIERKINRNGKVKKREAGAEAWSDWENFPKDLKENVYAAAIANYGTFGIITSITLEIIEGMETYFIATHIPWKNYLANEAHALANLNTLQNNSSSLEFFYYPFGPALLPPFWKSNDDVYLLRHLIANDENKTLLDHEHIKIVEKPELYFFIRDLSTRVGAQIISSFIYRLLQAKDKLILPHILALMPGRLEDTKGHAIKIPHWRANHSVNAIGAVELMSALDIEWAVPMVFNTKDGSGFQNPIKIFSTLISSIEKEAHDHHKFPVSIVAEMRFFRGSQALLAPEYTAGFKVPKYNAKETGPFAGWAAPELVTNSGNPWFPEFYGNTNQKVYELFAKSDIPVRCHLAKQFAMLPGMLKTIRNQFQLPPGHGDPVAKFEAIRKFIDPKSLFLNPFMQQLLDPNTDQYEPPKNYTINEEGTLQHQ